MKDKIKSIIIAGEGGQGVREIGHTLAKILLGQGLRVSLGYDYDAGVRGGKITAYLKFGPQEIVSPLAAKADILVKLSKLGEGLYHGREVICASEVGINCPDIKYDFAKMGRDKFGDQLFGNMIVVGLLLKKLSVKPTKIDFAKALPAKFQEENQKAILYGHDELI